MSTPVNTTPTVTVNDTTSPQFLNISHINIVKLTPTNYLAWKLQMEAILIGYDLFKYIDGSLPCPPPTIQQGTAQAPNPDHHQWIRQDKLLFAALVGSVSALLIPLIQQSTTSSAAWKTLAHTYARPSRGLIK